MGLMERWWSAMTAGPQLPAEYTRVNWLHSDGNQRIIITDTFYTGVNFKLTCQSDSTTGTEVIFGYGAGGGLWFGASGGKYGIANNSFSNVQLTDKVDAIIRFTGGKIYVTIGSTSVNVTYGTNTIRSLSIFSGQGSSAWYSAQCKIYGLSAKGIVNLIPCIRTADNKPGMYDTVTNTFLTNSGTGEFTYG
jgi:hypothetical protein